MLIGQIYINGDMDISYGVRTQPFLMTRKDIPSRWIRVSSVILLVFCVSYKRIARVCDAKK